jgi:chromosomal replication initiation ATPase DnaA
MEQTVDLVDHYKEVRQRLNQAGYRYAKNKEVSKLLKVKQTAEDMVMLVNLEREIVNDLKSNWRLIVEKIAMRIDRPVEEFLKSKSRERNLTFARQEAYYLLRRQTNMSLPQIGKKFGKDHTTILSGYLAHIKRNRLEQ